MFEHLFYLLNELEWYRFKKYITIVYVLLEWYMENFPQNESLVDYMREFEDYMTLFGKAKPLSDKL